MNDCDKFRLLKQEYESALSEEALYEYGGAASPRQAIRYESEAIAASAHARDRLITHYKVCPSCKVNSARNPRTALPLHFLEDFFGFSFPSAMRTLSRSDCDYMLSP